MHALAFVGAVLLPAAASAQDGRIVVAVFPLQDTAQVLSDDAEKNLTDYYGVKLAESGRFIIVPRNDIESAVRRLKAESYDACYDQSCQIEIGKEVAAQKALHTQVVRVGDSCAVASTLYDLRMGAAETAASERGGCTENELVESIEKVATTLGARTGAAPSATAPPPPPPPPAAPPPPATPTFSLRVTADPSTADVLVDGKRYGTGAGVTIPLDPNREHTLTVEADGYVAHSEVVSLTRDDRRTIALTMSAETRRGRHEWFGVSLGGSAMASGAIGAGLWVRVANLAFGGFSWTVLDAYGGVSSGPKSVSTDEDCTSADIGGNGYCRTSAVSPVVFLGTRAGYRLDLGGSGDHILQLGIAPGLYAVVDGEVDDRITAFAVAPVVQYLAYSDRAFTWGVGLRVIIPVAGGDTCRLGVKRDPEESVSVIDDYARCTNSNPLMFQLEVPLGWYL